ncbi:MAG TPA: hypothetical protein VFY15_07685 [Acidimicrobiia bacterium]|nr:hypothetical protein [Acidimicrobiia bacterium]
MPLLTRWHRWGRTALIGLVSGVVAWFAFAAARPVPLLDWFDLAIHEAAHLVAAPLPEVAMFAAGSVAQVAFPLVMAGYFGLRRRDVAAAGFCLVWAGASAWDVSVYAADAISQNLPLVGGGQHDWAWLLGHFGALDRTHQVAGIIESAGGLIAAAGFGAIALALLPMRVPTSNPMLAVRARPVPAADPWLAASRLPFRHDDGGTQAAGFSVGGGGSGVD